MSLKSDILAVTLAGAVLLGAAWYAKKKVTGAVAGVGDAVKGTFNGAAGAVDGWINAAGQWVTGDAGWTNQNGHSPQYNYQIPPDFGVIDPSTWE
ncbi:hypothetical protein GTP45_10640 [Pseudoduganella sp. FT55W]|uniref:Uncharacterized protein n=1 Tax=Duganella rivi TaxID=2666083 RepID=A0A7X4GPI4_9BURK|nr:hypothetical protein [Duganella rivi]MYM67287.1 hypothetical protein [Duganella rivi]